MHGTVTIIKASGGRVTTRFNEPPPKNLEQMIGGSPKQAIEVIFNGQRAVMFCNDEADRETHEINVEAWNLALDKRDPLLGPVLGDAVVVNGDEAFMKELMAAMVNRTGPAHR